MFEEWEDFGIASVPSASRSEARDEYATGARRNRMYCASGSALRCRSRISRSG